MCPGQQGEFLARLRLGHCTDKSLPPILACTVLTLPFRLYFFLWFGCKSFFSFFLLRFITPSFVLTACSLSLCLVSLLVSLSTSLSYFASCYFFFLSTPYSLLLLVYYLAILVFMHKTSLFCRSRLVYPVQNLSPLIFFPVFLTFCLFFLWYIEFSAAGAFREDIPGVQGSGNRNPSVLVINAAQ